MVFYTRFHATLKKVLRLLIILPQRNWHLPSPAPSTNSKPYDKTPARLLKYPQHAITGLLPAALGKAGESRDNARAALRMLIENGYPSLLQEIAQRYNQPEVTDAVNALLALDPLDNHPTKIPTLPAFYQPSLWTRPVLKANAQSLPDSALFHLGEMLRFPQEEVLYPGLLQVKDACTADSLAEFVWDLFTARQTAGAPSKEELGVHCVRCSRQR